MLVLGSFDLPTVNVMKPLLPYSHANFCIPRLILPNNYLTKEKSILPEDHVSVGIVDSTVWFSLQLQNQMAASIALNEIRYESYCKTSFPVEFLPMFVVCFFLFIRILWLQSWAYQFQGDFFGMIVAVSRGCRPWCCGFHLRTVIITAQFG